MRSFAQCVCRCVVLAAGLLAVAPRVSAQGAVGSGPLTSMLPDEEPKSGVLHAGVFRIAPGLTIREIGHDDNVFNEALNPKEDWVVAGRPDVTVYTRVPMLELSAYAGSDMQWYKTYESERSVGYMYRARADVLLSRVFPFVGGGRTQTRNRPNGEIDARAEQQIDELSGGIGYSFSENGSMFGSWIESALKYQDEFQSGVNLNQSLSHHTTEYQAGLRTDLTPLLSMQLRGSYREDDFDLDDSRNGDTRAATAEFVFDQSAVISGVATIGFEDYQPVNPLVRTFRGVTGSGFLRYPFFEIGTFNFGYNHSREYSFDSTEAYYVDTTLRLVYTQRLFGAFDLQGQAAHSTLDYGNGENGSERKDTLETYNGNLGYNLPNKTRLSMNYEYARRRSPNFAEREFIRRRIYMSWMVAF